MRRVLVRPVAALAALLGATAPAACSGHGGDGTAKTYAIETESARPDETALRLRPVVDGDTRFTLLGLTTGMTDLVGSHADVAPRGRFVRVRLGAVNHGRTTAIIDTLRQRLYASDGRGFTPDREAMTIKRQPLTFDLGAEMRVEFDLWYDVPAGAKVTGMRLFGGATLTDMKDEEGTDVHFAHPS